MQHEIVAQVLRWLADGEKIQGRRTNELMDWKNFPEEFSSTFNHALIHEAVGDMEFRLAPRTIRVNGVDVLRQEIELLTPLLPKNTDCSALWAALDAVQADQ